MPSLHLSSLEVPSLVRVSASFCTHSSRYILSLFVCFPARRPSAALNLGMGIPCLRRHGISLKRTVQTHGAPPDLLARAGKTGRSYQDSQCLRIRQLRQTLVFNYLIHIQQNTLHTSKTASYTCPASETLYLNERTKSSLSEKHTPGMRTPPSGKEASWRPSTGSKSSVAFSPALSAKILRSCPAREAEGASGTGTPALLPKNEEKDHRSRLELAGGGGGEGSTPSEELENKPFKAWTASMDCCTWPGCTTETVATFNTDKDGGPRSAAPKFTSVPRPSGWRTKATELGSASRTEVTPMPPGLPGGGEHTQTSGEGGGGGGGSFPIKNRRGGGGKGTTVGGGFVGTAAGGGSDGRGGARSLPGNVPGGGDWGVPEPRGGGKDGACGGTGTGTGTGRSTDLALWLGIVKKAPTFLNTVSQMEHIHQKRRRRLLEGRPWGRPAPSPTGSLYSGSASESMRRRQTHVEGGGGELDAPTGGGVTGTVIGGAAGGPIPVVAGGGGRATARISESHKSPCVLLPKSLTNFR